MSSKHRRVYVNVDKLAPLPDRFDWTTDTVDTETGGGGGTPQFSLTAPLLLPLLYIFLFLWLKSGIYWGTAATRWAGQDDVRAE